MKRVFLLLAAHTGHGINLAKCSMYVCESPRAKTRLLGYNKFFDLDTPLKCGESPLSIPLCGEIR
jgi:hypothetical protein